MYTFTLTTAKCSLNFSGFRIVLSIGNKMSEHKAISDIFEKYIEAKEWTVELLSSQKMASFEINLKT
jgi:hypothetical protein